MLVSQILGAHPDVPEINLLLLFTLILPKTRSFPFLPGQEMVAQNDLLGVFPCLESPQQSQRWKPATLTPYAQLYCRDESSFYHNLPLPNHWPALHFLRIALSLQNLLQKKPHLRTPGPQKY